MSSSARPAIVATLIGCTLALLPTLTFRFGADQGVFAYMGGELLHGRWPYLQTWEHDFPGLMFLQAAEIFVLGRSIVMFRLFDLVLQLGVAMLVFRITLRVAGSRTAAALGAIVYCLIYQSYGPWNTAQREGFTLVFIIGGYWLELTSDRRRAWVTALLVGLGFGIGVLIKPTVLALCLYYLPLVRRADTARVARLAGVALIGLLAPALALLAVYAGLDGLTSLYEACIKYQSIYTVQLRGDEPLLGYWLQKIASLGRQSVVLPIAFAPFLLLPSHRDARVRLFLGYLGSLYAVFFQGTFAGYHYLPGLAIGAVFIGVMFAETVERVIGGRVISIGSLRPALATCIAVAIMAGGAFWYIRRSSVERLVTGAFLRAPAPNEFRIDPVFDFTEDYDAAQYLASHTQPREPIQIWGYESLIYYIADRPASSRFQTMHPLIMRPPDGMLAPMQEQWRVEFLADMINTPPAYVVVVRDDPWWWSPQKRTSEALLDDFPAWKQIIADRYQLEQTMGRFLIYRRTPERRNASVRDPR
jgi:hypothetical protein